MVFLHQLHPVPNTVSLQRIAEDHFHGSKLCKNTHMHFMMERNIIQSRETDESLFVRAAHDSYLSVVGDTPVDVLHPLAAHGTEAYLQLLGDHIAAETQPAAHLDQRVIIPRQRLQDLVRERANKGRDD